MRPQTGHIMQWNFSGSCIYLDSYLADPGSSIICIVFLVQLMGSRRVWTATFGTTMVTGATGEPYCYELSVYFILINCLSEFRVSRLYLSLSFILKLFIF